MNFCMCGAQAGYPHDPQCPYPYYGRDETRQDGWLEDWNERVRLSQQPKTSHQPPTANDQPPPP